MTLNGKRRKPSARQTVGATLAREILDDPRSKDFAIESEHQLCRRFSVSRVTIRLVLGDLENRGLIYRHHGKGTFAHGCPNRVHRSLGLLLKSPDDLETSAVVDFIRGAQTVATAHSSSIHLLSTSPLTWRPDMVNSMGSVLVLHDDLTGEELCSLQNRNLPFICIFASEHNQDTDAFQHGFRVANELFQAVLTGKECRQPLLAQ